MENKKTIINVLGTGCPSCITLENNTKKAVEELNLEARINKISDIEDIIGYGVMNTPALVINNKITCSGRVPDVEEIKNMLIKEKQEYKNPTSCGCSCGGKC